MASKTPAYDHVGAQRDSAQVRARLRGHCVWPDRRARSDVGGTSASLTPSERTVAERMRQRSGCESPLYAEHTVAKHVSKILAELELRSRIQIAGVLASPQGTARMSEQTDTLAI